MKRSGKLPELLAPAGSFEALLGAVEGGADAVYIGGKSYGARAFAKNFDLEEIERAVRYAHLHSVKVYVTVNVLLYDRELDDCMAYVRSLYEIGVDAVIVADLGLVRRIRRELPEMEIHGSTQMSVHNTAGAEEVYRMGVSRVVVARELSLENIVSVTENASAEIEIFAHGALCVCHSGQCLFSSLVGGRSGNRGECAQPCRLSYNGKPLLSLCDLSLAEHIREVVASGVSSLKIEGRMKAPSYVYGVTKIYRELLDGCRNATRRESMALADLFSRGGRFTDGYFTGRINERMTGVRTEADKEASRSEERSFSPIPKRVFARAKFHLGKPSEMTIFDENREVTVYGDIPSPAQNSPLKLADLQTRLCKMGATFLSLDKNDLEIDLEEGINLSPSAINALRRAAAEKFENTRRSLPEKTPEKERLSRSSLATTLENKRVGIFYQASALDGISERSLSQLDIRLLPLFSYRENSPANGVLLPPIVLDNEWERVREMLTKIQDKITYIMIDNISHLALVRGWEHKILGGFRLNITNSYTRAFYADSGIADVTLSPELTEPRIADIGGGVITYGRIPLMITERCFVRENGGCDRCGSFRLVDRMGKAFPILREFEHRNLIFNAIPTYMGDRLAKIRSMTYEVLIFSVESAKECEKVLASYTQGAPLMGDVRRIK